MADQASTIHYLTDRELDAIDRLDRAAHGRFAGWAVDPFGRVAVDVRRHAGDDCERFTGQNLLQALRLAHEAVEAGRA